MNRIIKPSAKFEKEEIEVGVGHLTRTFQRSEERWEFSEEEAAQFINTGFFEIDDAAEKAAVEAAQKEAEKAAEAERKKAEKAAAIEARKAEKDAKQ